MSPIDLTDLHGRTHAQRWPTRSCSVRWRSWPRGFVAQAAAARAGAAGVRGAARHWPRHQEPRAGPPRSLSRGVTRRRCRRRAARCTGRATAEDARAASSGHLPRGRRAGRHQGQVDDLRGDRPQRRSRGGRHRRRSKTDLGEYIIQLARRDAEPHHRARRPPDPATRSRPTSARPTPQLPPDRQPDARPRRWSPRRARSCARSSSHADVGITGANFLIAETGTSVIVTNEGNGDLTQYAAQGAYRARLHREDGADARGCIDAPARAGALGHRPGDLDLHHLRRPARAAPAIPDGPERIPRRAARQRPLGAARHRVRRHAALHPLRRLHESLPGLHARSAATPMAGSIPARSARC